MTCETHASHKTFSDLQVGRSHMRFANFAFDIIICRLRHGISSGCKSHGLKSKADGCNSKLFAFAAGTHDLIGFWSCTSGIQTSRRGAPNNTYRDALSFRMSMQLAMSSVYNLVSISGWLQNTFKKCSGNVSIGAY